MHLNIRKSFEGRKDEKCARKNFSSYFACFCEHFFSLPLLFSCSSFLKVFCSFHEEWFFMLTLFLRVGKRVFHLHFFINAKNRVSWKKIHGFFFLFFQLHRRRNKEGERKKKMIKLRFSFMTPPFEFSLPHPTQCSMYFLMDFRSLEPFFFLFSNHKILIRTFGLRKEREEREEKMRMAWIVSSIQSLKVWLWSDLLKDTKVQLFQASNSWLNQDRLYHEKRCNYYVFVWSKSDTTESDTNTNEVWKVGDNREEATGIKSHVLILIKFEHLKG